VFFENEPILIRLEIANPFEAHHTLLTAAADVREAVRVRTLHNGERADIPVVVSPQGWRRDRSSVTPLTWAQGMAIGPGGTLRWDVEVLGRPLQPGFYRLEFAVLATDEQSRPIAPRAPTFEFEVRQALGADEPEILRRAAERHYRAKEYSEAEQKVAQLLQRHPSSFAAYLILGRIEQSRGRPAASEQHVARALAILESGADSLFVESSDALEVERTIENIRLRATPLREAVK
jgi:hypothetical protein